jgi:hypothetical protein
MPTPALSLIVALLLGPAVQKASDAYDYGDFAGACRQLEAARVSADTPSADQPALLRLLGACHQVQHHEEAAAEAWRAWLVLEPAAALDPVVYPPEMVEFFRRLKPSAPTPAAPASVAAPEPAPTTLAPAPASVEPTAGPRGDKSMALAVLPFGLGQFQNGHTTKGWFFAAFDAAALGFAVVNLYRTESLKTSGSFLGGGKYATDADRQTAEQSLNFYVAGFAIFGALWAYGAVDALTHFEEPAPTASFVPRAGGLGLTWVLP